MSTRRTLSLAAKLFPALLGMALLNSAAHAQTINWRSSLDAAKAEASRTGKLVLLHFYTSNCGPCKKLDREVFSQPQIGVALERDYVPVKFNADDAPAIANAFQVKRVPSEIVLTSQGNIVQKLSCPLEPNAYGAQLVNVAQHYRQRVAKSGPQRQTPIHSAYSGLKIGQPNNGQAEYHTATAPRSNQKSTANAGAPANIAPIAPAVTKNPYVSAAPPATQQRQAVAAALPANAMPNSYRNRYAAAPQQSSPGSQAASRPPKTGSEKLPASGSTPVTTAPLIAATTAAPSAADPPTATTSSTTPSSPTEAVASQDTVPGVASSPALVEAWPPQLPPSAPPLAFDGYCPVSLRELGKWVRGKKSIGAFHRGRTYLFADEPERQKFLAAADSYSPVFSGNDPVKLLDEQEEVAGSRKFGFEYHGAFYLFASKETMARFASQPAHYSAGVRQAMNRLDAVSNDTIRR